MLKHNYALRFLFLDNNKINSKTTLKDLSDYLLRNHFGVSEIKYDPTTANYDENKLIYDLIKIGDIKSLEKTLEQFKEINLINFVEEKKLNDFDIKILAEALVNNHSIKYIHLCCDITVEGADALKNALEKNQNIHVLSLENSKFDDASAEIIAAGLENNYSLRRISLKNCNIGDQSALFFAKALINNENISTISFANNEITESVYKEFEALLKTNHNIIKIDLFDNHISLGKLKSLYEIYSAREKIYTKLFSAIHSCDWNTIAKLQKDGVRINLRVFELLNKNKTGDTPLHIAVRSGSILMVSFILQFNLNLEHKNRDSKTALELAEELHKEDICKLINAKKSNNLIPTVAADTTSGSTLSALQSLEQEPTYEQLSDYLTTLYSNFKLEEMLKAMLTSAIKDKGGLEELKNLMQIILTMSDGKNFVKQPNLIVLLMNVFSEFSSDEVISLINLLELDKINYRRNIGLPLIYNHDDVSLAPVTSILFDSMILYTESNGCLKDNTQNYNKTIEIMAKLDHSSLIAVLKNLYISEEAKLVSQNSIPPALNTIFKRIFFHSDKDKISNEIRVSFLSNLLSSAEGKNFFVLNFLTNDELDEDGCEKRGQLEISSGRTSVFAKNVYRFMVENKANKVLCKEMLSAMINVKPQSESIKLVFTLISYDQKTTRNIQIDDDITMQSVIDSSTWNDSENNKPNFKNASALFYASKRFIDKDKEAAPKLPSGHL